jgi:hypothetical protein
MSPSSEETKSRLSDEELSQYWYCPDDRNMLQLHHGRRAQSPYFDITRNHIEIGINNAIAVRRIPPDAKPQTKSLVTLLFNQDPALDCVDLVGVICPKCGRGFSAPKIQAIVGVAKDQARVIFEETRALQSKTFGPFRIVDHFGLGSSLNRNDRSSTGRRSLWFYMFFIGLRTLFMILFLYYILGFEVRVGKRWLPLGPVLLIVLVLGGIVIAVNSGILGFFGGFFSGYY